MSDLDPVQILADLTTQGLADDVDVQAVAGTTDLWQRTPGFDPAAWAYDPDGDPAANIYAPTAAEMEPDLVPEGGWPPVQDMIDESAGGASPTGSEAGTAAGTAPPVAEPDNL